MRGPGSALRCPALPCTGEEFQSNALARQRKATQSEGAVQLSPARTREGKAQRSTAPRWQGISGPRSAAAMRIGAEAWLREASFSKGGEIRRDAQRRRSSAMHGSAVRRQRSARNGQGADTQGIARPGQGIDKYRTGMDEQREAKPRQSIDAPCRASAHLGKALAGLNTAAKCHGCA